MAAVCVFYLAFGFIEITNEPQTCENWYRAPAAAESVVNNNNNNNNNNTRVYVQR